MKNHDICVSFKSPDLDDKDIIICDTDLPTLLDIYQTLLTRIPKADSCFPSFFAQLKANVSSDYYMPHNCIVSSLDLQPIFNGKTKRTPCMATTGPIPQTHRNMFKMCARNLCAGKCQDEFMREIFGTVLFPKLYTKQKVK